jgi:biopolymer transport protein ExbD
VLVGVLFVLSVAYVAGARSYAPSLNIQLPDESNDKKREVQQKEDMKPK